MSIVNSSDGFKWEVGGSETDDHLVLGGHEPALGPILRSMCDPSRGYVNIGAHVGTWAVRLAQYSRYVIALEANPLTAAKLERNVELNGLSKKVKAVNTAVWDEDGQFVVMVDVNSKPTGGSTRAVLDDPLSNNTKVKTYKLDTLFSENWTDVGLISMDVEGAEAKVLRGGKNLIMASRPNMVIELHEGHPGTDSDLRQQVYDLLVELNYSFTSVAVSPPEEHLLCYPAENRPSELDEMLPA